MSKGGGGGGSSTTVQKADPWVGVQGPLKDLYANTQKWYQGGGPQYYPGQEVAGMNGAQQTALNQGTQMAMQGPSQQFQQAQQGLASTAQGINPWDNPGMATMNGFGNGFMMNQNPAQQYFQNSTNGQYTSNQNPYLQGMYQSAARPMIDQFQRAIAPGIASQFSMAGRTGSGAHQAAFQGAEDSLGRALGDMGTNMYGQAYESERGRQQQAAGQLASMNQFDQSNMMRGAENMSNNFFAGRQLQQAAQLAAPQFEQMKYNDLDKLLGIGEYQQGQEQQFRDADKRRFDFGQNQPYQNLQAYSQILNGAAPYATQTSNASNAQRRNPFNSGMGGAFMGGALGPMMGMTGPMGAIGGALLGGLFG